MLDGGVDDGRDGFFICPTSVFSFASFLSSFSFTPSSLISFSCFTSLEKEGGQVREELEAVDSGRGGFSSLILAAEASGFLVFVVSLSVSIGSMLSDTGAGTGEDGAKPLTESFAESAAGFSVLVSSSWGRAELTVD